MREWHREAPYKLVVLLLSGELVGDPSAATAPGDLLWSLLWELVSALKVVPNRVHRRRALSLELILLLMGRSGHPLAVRPRPSRCGRRREQVELDRLLLLEAVRGVLADPLLVRVPVLTVRRARRPARRRRAQREVDRVLLLLLLLMDRLQLLLEDLLLLLLLLLPVLMDIDHVFLLLRLLERRGRHRVAIFRARRPARRRRAQREVDRVLLLLLLLLLLLDRLQLLLEDLLMLLLLLLLEKRRGPRVEIAVEHYPAVGLGPGPRRSWLRSRRGVARCEQVDLLAGQLVAVDLIEALVDHVTQHCGGVLRKLLRRERLQPPGRGRTAVVGGQNNHSGAAIPGGQRDQSW